MTQDAAERFTGKVQVYERYRERYDAALILSRLRAWCGLAPEWTIADVGAGTGMLADVFLGNGNEVVAVEPNAAMRSACAASHAEHGRITVRDGNAEATGLPDASADAVAVGRALHWFDFDRAMEEFRRVLRPRGWVFVISVGRDDEGRDENVALGALMQRYAPAGETVRAGYASYRRLPSSFERGAFHHEAVAASMFLDWATLLGYAESISYAPRAGSETFPAFAQDLRTLFERFQRDGQIELAVRHWVNAGRWD